MNMAQMEHWSILSDKIKYVKHDEYSTNGIDIKTVDYWDHKGMYKRIGKEEGQTLDVDFEENPKVLKEKFMDMYEGVFADMVASNKFDENVDLSTTYLVKNWYEKKGLGEGRREISNLRARVCCRKIVRWYRMSDFVRYRCE